MQLLIGLQMWVRDDVENCNDFIIKTEDWDWTQLMMLRDTDCVSHCVDNYQSVKLYAKFAHTLLEYLHEDLLCQSNLDIILLHFTENNEVEENK